MARLNLQAEQRVEPSVSATQTMDRTIDFARFALESLPIALVCVNGRGDFLLTNAEARRLLRTERTEPLDRALAAAVQGARRSPTGYHAEPFGDAGGTTGVVVAAAGTEPLHLATQRGDEPRGRPAPAAAGAETPP
jgi:PAS domain-containing protein